MIAVLQVAPNYWESLAAVLAMFAVGSLFLQQALTMVFEQDVFKRFNERSREGRVVRYRFVVDTKPVISLACSLVLMFQFQFDVFAAVFQGGVSGFSLVVTALLFSGGAHSVARLYKAYQQIRDAETEQRIAKAKE